MTSREHLRSRIPGIYAGIIPLLLVLLILFCGCLQVEPEELPPQAVLQQTEPPVSPTVPANTLENVSSAHRAIVITSPKLTRGFTDQDFPPEVQKAVSDFAEGKTSDTINGFLRWESVRARTNLSDAARIREQIRRIDYAVFNTTIQENISIYIGVSGEQAKRIRNESVFSEPGYAVGSYDPSVVYYRLRNSGRDSEGYITMCVVDFRKGNHLLYVNATAREFLLPHDSIWDVAGEETFEDLEFSQDSIPQYKDILPTKVRLISTKEHP
jgi:hypothetical protein